MLPAPCVSTAEDEERNEVEMLVQEMRDSLLDEPRYAQKNEEADGLKELAVGSPAAHSTADEQARGAEDAFQSYLRDIRRLGLLTAAEELELARRADAGDEGARRRLTESNLRLVIAIARHYTSTGVPLIDLIGEGNLGLIQAC